MALLLVAGYFLITQSFLTRWVVMAVAGRMTGGVADASSVIIQPGGRIIITDATLRAPGVPGTGGEVFSVKRLEATFDWQSLFQGPAVVHEVTLDRPTARISQSADDFSVNFAALKPKKGGGKGLKKVPRILVRGGVIELGEHVTDPERLARGVPQYTRLKAIDVGGQVIRSPDNTGASLITFHEVQGENPIPGGLAVKGRVSKSGIQLTLEGLSLSTWNAEVAPTQSRQLFRQTAMQGEVPSATVTYDFAGGWEARITLKGVALNLPVKERPELAEDGTPIPGSYDPDRQLRMEHVDGEIVFTNHGVEGNLVGTLEELPYGVTFRVNGTSADAGFTCTLVSSGFQLTETPQIMRFAPRVVRKRLAQFGNPTGIVDAKVIVTRADPVDGKEGDIAVAGTLTFRNATAAFHKFPYEFINMTGEIAFDEEKVELVRIEGEAPGGVRIHADGLITPPTDDAFVDVNVRVSNLPVDHRLTEALGKRQRVMREVFNEERYRALIEEGVIATREQHEAAIAELARIQGDPNSPRVRALRAIAERPVFELGGRAEVVVKVTREAGPDSEWFDVETIRLPEAGVLPEAFPYPMIARDVTIIKRDTDAVMEGGTYHGLLGGTAHVTARVDFERVDNPNAPFVPDVQISARGVPFDELMIHAIPDTTPGKDGLSFRDQLRALNIRANADFDVRIGMTPADEPGFTVAAKLRDASAAPLVRRDPDQAPRLLMSGVNGEITVTQDSLAVSLSSNLAPIATPDQSARADIRLSLPIRTDSSKPEPVGGLTATAKANRFDASIPVEDLVEVFAPEVGATLRELRARYQPSGLVDVRTTLEQPRNSTILTTTVMADNAHRLQANIGDGRLEFAGRSGGVTITAPSEGRATLTIHALAGDLRFNHDPASEVFLEGVLGLDGLPAGGAGLRGSIRAHAFESGLTLSALRALAPPSLVGFYEASRPKGLFDFDLSMTPAGEAWNIHAGVWPRNASLVYDGTVLTFPVISGGIEIENEGGRLRNIALSAPDWSAAVDGSWMNTDSGGTAIITTISVNSIGLPPDMLSLLPKEVRDEMQSISFDAAGPVEAKDNQLSMVFSKDGELHAFRARGRVGIRGGRMDVGVSISRIEGAFDYLVSRTGPDDPAEFQLRALLDYFAAAGINMTNGAVRVHSTDDGGVEVPHLSADCHGGRVAGTARLSPPFRGSGKRRFEAQISASDVRLASILSDYENADVVGPPNLAEPPDESRGRLDAGLSIGGIIGDPLTRRGRGTMTIGGGRILNLPLLIPLIRVTNLQLPMNERLDYGVADFYIQGNQAVFTELTVSSQSVDIYGYGTATLPDFKLDLRFKTQSRARIPIFTRLMEDVRDAVLLAEVKGTLAEPDIGVRPLPGPTRILERIFGGRPSAQDRQLEQIEARAKSDPRRRRTPGRELVYPQ